jgi:hypothetical protein
MLFSEIRSAPEFMKHSRPSPRTLLRAPFVLSALLASASATTAEPRVYSVILSGRYVQSEIVQAQVLGTNLTEIVAMAIIIDRSQPFKGRLTPEELANVKDSDWVEFHQKMEVELGQGEGERQIFFGFKSASGMQSWQRYRIDVDRTPPDLAIWNPTGTVVSEPIIQLTGASPEQLKFISLDLTNANRTVADQTVSITRRVFDPDRRKLAATEFQCYDLQLAPGTNTITLHATDLAGNTASKQITFVLDPSIDKTPPQVTIDWPKPGEEINAKTFRLRGRVDEPTARIQVFSPTGEPNEGLVERDGLFWVPNLPIPDQINEFTVQATDYAGNVATKSIMVRRSAIEIGFDPLQEDQRKKKNPTLTGSVSDPNCAVWVNGVQADVNGKKWKVKDVPVNGDSGTAVFQATAIPSSITAGRGYGATKPPTLRDMGNPRLSPENIENH